MRRRGLIEVADWPYMEVSAAGVEITVVDEGVGFDTRLPAPLSG